VLPRWSRRAAAASKRSRHTAGHHATRTSTPGFKRHHEQGPGDVQHRRHRSCHVPVRFSNVAHATSKWRWRGHRRAGHKRLMGGWDRGVIERIAAVRSPRGRRRSESGTAFRQSFRCDDPDAAARLGPRGGRKGEAPASSRCGRQITWCCRSRRSPGRSMAARLAPARSASSRSRFLAAHTRGSSTIATGVISCRRARAR